MIRIQWNRIELTAKYKGHTTIFTGHYISLPDYEVQTLSISSVNQIPTRCGLLIARFFLKMRTKSTRRLKISLYCSFNKKKKKVLYGRKTRYRLRICEKRHKYSSRTKDEFWGRFRQNLEEELPYDNKVKYLNSITDIIHHTEGPMGGPQHESIYSSRQPWNFIWARDLLLKLTELWGY